MSLQADLSRNYLSLAAARFTAKAIAFIAAVLIARRLGAEDFGIFTFAFAATTLAVVIFQAGLTNLVVREIARDRAQAPHYLTMSLLVRTAGGFAVVGVCLGIYAVTGAPGAAAAAIAGGALGLSGLVTSFTEVFQAFERMEFVAVVLAFNNLLLLGLIVYADHIRAGVMTMLGIYAAANALSIIPAAVICGVKFARPAGRVAWRDLKRFCRAAVPFSFSALVAGLFWRSDRILLKLFAGDRAVGIYGAASSLVEGLVLVSGSFREAVFPVLSRFWPSSPDPFRDASRTAFKFLVALALPIGVGTALVAHKLFPFIYGAGYAEGWPVLAVLIWALVAIFIRELTAATLFAFNLEKLVLASNALGAAASVAVNAALIPRFSFMGAAAAGVLTALATTAFNLVIIATKVRKLYPWRLALRPALAAALMAAALYASRHWHVLFTIALGAAVYGAGILATRYYRLGQIGQLFRRPAPPR